MNKVTFWEQCVLYSNPWPCTLGKCHNSGCALTTQPSEDYATHQFSVLLCIQQVSTKCTSQYTCSQLKHFYGTHNHWGQSIGHAWCRDLENYRNNLDLILWFNLSFCLTFLDAHKHILSSLTDSHNCTSLQNHKSTVKQNTLCPRQRVPTERKQNVNGCLCARQLQSLKTHLNKHLHRNPSTHQTMPWLTLSVCNQKCRRPGINCDRLKRWKGRTD